MAGFEAQGGKGDLFLHDACVRLVRRQVSGRKTSDGVWDYLRPNIVNKRNTG